MLAQIKYTDWQITKLHAREINNLPTLKLPLPAAHRKRIPAVRGDSIGDELKSGVWLAPLGSSYGTTFSSVQDVGHSTLVLMAQGTSTDQTDSEPDFANWRQQIADLFHNKRVLGLPGEMYSTVDLMEYNLSERLSRTMDVVALRITSWFREDRR